MIYSLIIYKYVSKEIIKIVSLIENLLLLIIDFNFLSINSNNLITLQFLIISIYLYYTSLLNQNFLLLLNIITLLFSLLNINNFISKIKIVFFLFLIFKS